MRNITAVNRQQIIGQSYPFRRLIREAKLVSRASEPVLITGESGAGQETVALLIHESGGRAGRFIAVNCGAIPSHLMEAELFGYVAGDFTDAAPSGKVGLLEQADGGTLFLDEVEELEPRCQAALLRFLDSRHVRRLGATRETLVDVRIVAATSRDLRERSKARQFRYDLYFRLAKREIEVPPLRERGTDVVMIARRQMQLASADYGRKVRLSHEAARVLHGHDWPGNVFEVEQVVRQLVRDKNRRLTAETLLRAIGKSPDDLVLDLKQSLLEALQRQGTASAAQLRKMVGGSRTTIWRHLEELVELGRIECRKVGRSVIFALPGWEWTGLAETTAAASQGTSEPPPAANTVAGDVPRQKQWRLLEPVVQLKGISPQEAAALLQTPVSNAKTVLYALVGMGKLRATGTTRNRRYWPAFPPEPAHEVEADQSPTVDGGSRTSEPGWAREKSKDSLGSFPADESQAAETALGLIATRGSISSGDLARCLGIKAKPARRILTRLAKEGQVEKRGRTSDRRYFALGPVAPAPADSATRMRAPPPGDPVQGLYIVRE